MPTAQPPEAEALQRRSPAVSDRRSPPVRRGLRLGSLFGIEIRLEFSWFFIFAFLILAFAANLAAAHPTLGPAVKWSVALGASLLFFSSILLHELAHSMVARSLGIPVHGITLLLFGGISHLANEPKRPREDLAIAIVGPLTSALLGAFFLAVARLLDPFAVARSVAFWLGVINLGLAGFNMIPGFPLDGGRVLRAVLWASTGDPAKAQRFAASAGRLVALGLIIAGLVLAIGWNRMIDGAWIGFMGWYLLSGSQANRLQLALTEVLKSHLVQDVVRPPEALVRAAEPMAELVEEWILRKGHRTMLVCEQTRLLGLVTLHEIQRIPREEWANRTAGQIMIPAERLVTAGPQETLLDAFRRMDERAVSQLPVVSEGALVGTVTREDLLRLLAVHAEINKRSPVRSGEGNP
jgi:Zn-dependent protease/CBS domain-containing protein